MTSENSDNENNDEAKVERVQTPLELEFWALRERINPEIEEHIKQAQEHLRAAVKLSTEHGVPFSSAVSEIRQGYAPKSFTDKFGPLAADDEVLEALYYRLDVGLDALKYPYGWEHSRICFD